MGTKGKTWIRPRDAEGIVLLRTKYASADISYGRWAWEGYSRRFCPRGKNLAMEKRGWNGAGVMLKKRAL
jgi:hypothetical protein